MCPVSHVNIQINIQYVTDEPEQTDRYGKKIADARKVVREERINLTSEIPGVAFERAKSALDVLNS